MRLWGLMVGKLVLQLEGRLLLRAWEPVEVALLQQALLVPAQVLAPLRVLVRMVVLVRGLAQEQVLPLSWAGFDGLALEEL